MWIGANELEVNEATMMAALQYWLDNKVLNKDEKSPKVTSVKPSACDNTFRVTLVND
jgi:hypothetical protein